MASATDVLTNLGLPGVVILGLGYAVIHLYRGKNKVEQGRLEDAKAVTGTLLQLQKDQLERDAGQDRLLESIRATLERTAAPEDSRPPRPRTRHT